ncbi:putative DNA-directed RNA polymerase subunit Rpb7 [Tetraselmis virus 1]|uniref:Putative DNA-directed RNA polymerase subunit Rpb7 n=1 Tax=Tetraselmis virus 1 TaxID=2060617 RepID=A0A2P0VNA0_9VIRU|nr:putative DNA-directed RNA polymerase subunit Rpb7 [Tetraselmis virus 1]AUF82378.1 putative DNA-directed RNA polymerase subunit Rpb7 [Tetraselmis virus 1]
MFQVISFKHPIKLKASEIGSNVREVIEDRARALMEGVCGEHGYIRQNTLRMTDVSSGKLSKIDMGRHYTFVGTFKAEVCNPVPGLRFNALVRSINRFGMLAEGGYYDPDGTLIPVIEIVIVRNPATIVNEVDLDELQIGDEIGVEVLGRQFELRESRISAYGRTVQTVKIDVSTGGYEGTMGDENEEDDIDLGEDGDDDGSVKEDDVSIASTQISDEGISVMGDDSDVDEDIDLDDDPDLPFPDEMEGV